jgi:glycosyltransferase involved in cell wall biosynthesis
VALPSSYAELQAGGGVMLHLPRLRWRADYSLQRLAEAGFVNIELEEGLDASVADPRPVAEGQGWFFEPGLAPGEVACSLSMLRLWERVVAEDLPYLLVFEDDVLPHPSMVERGEAYWAETPPDAEFVMLGNWMYLGDGVDRYRLVATAPASCFHAYVVTQAGAKRALSLLRRSLAQGRWLTVLDMELLYWMERWEVRAVCWNGTMLPKVFPTEEVLVSGASSVPPDVARSSAAATGTFRQNAALGSSIWPRREPPEPLVSGARGRGRRRAVLISAWVPSMAGNGSAIRVGVALEALARSHNVDLVLVPLYGALLDRALQFDWFASRFARRVHVLPRSVSDPFLGRVAAMAPEDQMRARVAYPRPVHVQFSTPGAAAHIASVIGDDVDLVYVFRLFLTPLAAPWLAGAHGGRRPSVVLDIDEDDPTTLRQIAALYRPAGPAGMIDVFEGDAAKLQELADTWVPRVDLVLASGPRDVATVDARYPNVDVRLLPNPTPPTGNQGNAPDVDVLFVGNCSYVPNIDSARWLCTAVLPLLQARLGRRVRVAIVGSLVDASVSELGGLPGVTVVADAPSVAPWYRSARIAVAPLRAAGGTRLKILEAFAYRRPVVSTSVGADGLPIVDGKHLLIADDAPGFADACARLLRDHELRSALVDAAVDVALAYARPRIMDQLTDMLLDVREAPV